jgi:prevent-host-death family protein
MARVPKMIPVSDLRADVAEVLRRVQDSREPLVITQRGRAAAVMLSVREYERVEYERQILRALARGEQEIAAGAGHDLDSVFEEADALLNADAPDEQ